MVAHDAGGPDPWSGLPESWTPESYFDAGETGCGEALLDLQIHFRALAPGTLVAIRTLDAGAPLEIPAWCRVTGHRLLEAPVPYFLTRVRTDPSKET